MNLKDQWFSGLDKVYHEDHWFKGLILNCQMGNQSLSPMRFGGRSFVELIRKISFILWSCFGNHWNLLYRFSSIKSKENLILVWNCFKLFGSVVLLWSRFGGSDIFMEKFKLKWTINFNDFCGMDLADQELITERGLV